MNSSKNWVLHVDPSVYKSLRKIPQEYARKIVHVIETLPNDPFSGDIDKMKGSHDKWRRRVGEYRIFYKIDVENKIILVFHVERRTSSTY